MENLEEKIKKLIIENLKIRTRERTYYSNERVVEIEILYNNEVVSMDSINLDR